MTGEGKHPVKPANQRGAARLAAVQALYQMDIAGSGVLEVVAEYEAHRLGQEVDGDTYLKADASWFRSIVAGVVRDQTKIDPMIAKAMGFLETHVQPSGGIYPKALDGQANYLTSIALVAFVEANENGKYKKTIDDAVKFVKGFQWSEGATGGAKVGPEDHRYGGFGYGSKARPDLSNTSFAIDALTTAGVPKDESAMLFSVIAGLPEDISVLFIEHDMDIVFSFASRITVLVAGAVLLEAEPEVVRSDPRVREVYLGQSGHA